MPEFNDLFKDKYSLFSWVVYNALDRGRNKTQFSGHTFWLNQISADRYKLTKAVSSIFLPGDGVSFGDDEGFDNPSMTTDAPSSLSFCVVSDSLGVGPI